MRVSEEVERALDLHGDAVMGLACSLLRSEADAFDVTQETFARYFISDGAFDSERHERNWLLKVAGNLCRDELRKARRRYERPVGLGTSEASAAMVGSRGAGLAGRVSALCPDSCSDRSEPTSDFDEDHVVWEYVGMLSPGLRQIVHLRYVEDLGISEIADMLGLTEVNVRVSLHRARKRLRGIIESYERTRKGESDAKRER